MNSLTEHFINRFDLRTVGLPHSFSLQCLISTISENEAIQKIVLLLKQQGDFIDEKVGVKMHAEKNNTSD